MRDFKSALEDEIHKKLEKINSGTDTVVKIFELSPEDSGLDNLDYDAFLYCYRSISELVYLVDIYNRNFEDNQFDYIAEGAQTHLKNFEKLIKKSANIECG